MRKKILVCIDCQNDFITGSLRNGEAISKVPNIVKKIRNIDWDIIFYTMDTHQENYLETKEGKELPVVHCVENTDGWKIEPNIKSALNDAVLRNIPVVEINKPTFGSYTLIDFIKGYIEAHEDETFEIEFIGFCTDICVISNVLMAKAAFYDIADILVDVNCCAGATIDLHKSALNVMKSCQIKIFNE